jgi:LAO/AO transport system kinase
VAEGVEALAEDIRKGNVRAIARAVTAIENGASEAEELIRILFPYTGKACRIGITGAPGTGKSTLVDKLAAHYRKQGLAAGILAVDPSSPFTGGAILGDRIRMQSHALDPGIYIRSMATRGYLGGLARATADASLVLDAAGKDYVLVETVGVGQGEIEIVRLADCTLVVLVPGMGDDIQNLKAGLMEIGDVFVLNKADREGAGRYEEQLRAVLSIVPARDGWKAPIIRTVATEAKGVAELAAEIEKFRAHFTSPDERRKREASLWRLRLEQLLAARLVGQIVRKEEKLITRLAEEVAERKKDPYAAVEEIVSFSDYGRQA